MRVNTILTSKEKVIEELEKEGYKYKNKNKTKKEKEEKKENEKEEKENNNVFFDDENIENVFVFPPNTSFLGNKLLNKGHIILQDKASCIPSFVLSPPPGSHVIDCCAAPV